MLTQEQVLGIVRHLLTAVGTILIVKGFVNDANWELITGTTSGLVSIIWSVFSKKK